MEMDFGEFTLAIVYTAIVEDMGRPSGVRYDTDLDRGAFREVC